MSINTLVISRLSPETLLLGFLYRSPCHGYELHQRLQDEFGDIWHTSQSQTYNILKRLVAQEIVDGTLIAQDKHPARLQLHITPRGVERFEAWLQQPTKPSVHALRVEFITRLYFTRLYWPERVEEMIKTQLEVVAAGLDQLNLQLVKIHDEQTIKWLALEMRLELLASVSHWLERCLELSKVAGPIED